MSPSKSTGDSTGKSNSNDARGNRHLYKESGVDVSKGERLVDWLKEQPVDLKSDRGTAVGGIGGFAGLFRPNLKGFEQPLLVSSTDGVGTKVLLGLETGNLEGLGIDLVAMCVNDLYTVGARPLFFLDYFATGHLDEKQFQNVLNGIKEGCHQSGMALMGGETAELPGLYRKGHFDLAGFVVGVVDECNVLGPDRTKPGDRLYSFSSSGFHANGYSLIRKWLADAKDPSFRNLWQTKLMIPTKIYHEIPTLVERLPKDAIHAMAHITGGGISGNLSRVIDKNLTAHLQKANMPCSTWMRDFIEASGTTLEDVEGVFNLGTGLIAVVDAAAAKSFESTAKELALQPIPIGELHAKAKDDAAKAIVYH